MRGLSHDLKLLKLFRSLQARSASLAIAAKYEKKRPVIAWQFVKTEAYNNNAIVYQYKLILSRHQVAATNVPHEVSYVIFNMYMYMQRPLKQNQIASSRFSSLLKWRTLLTYDGI